MQRFMRARRNPSGSTAHFLGGTTSRGVFACYTRGWRLPLPATRRAGAGTSVPSASHRCTQNSRAPYFRQTASWIPPLIPRKIRWEGSSRVAPDTRVRGTRSSALSLAAGAPTVKTCGRAPVSCFQSAAMIRSDLRTSIRVVAVVPVTLACLVFVSLVLVTREPGPARRGKTRQASCARARPAIPRSMPAKTKRWTG
jgi:hypothetical protein